jgi:hypothetical protein
MLPSAAVPSAAVPRKLRLDESMVFSLMSELVLSANGAIAGGSGE